MPRTNVVTGPPVCSRRRAVDEARVDGDDLRVWNCSVAGHRSARLLRWIGSIETNVVALEVGVTTPRLHNRHESRSARQIAPEDFGASIGPRICLFLPAGFECLRASRLI